MTDERKITTLTVEFPSSENLGVERYERGVLVDADLDPSEIGPDLAHVHRHVHWFLCVQHRKQTDLNFSLLLLGPKFDVLQRRATPQSMQRAVAELTMELMKFFEVRPSLADVLRAMLDNQEENDDDQ